MLKYSVGIQSHGIISPLGRGVAEFQSAPEVGKVMSILLSNSDSWSSYRIVELNIDQPIDGDMPQVVVERAV